MTMEFACIDATTNNQGPEQMQGETPIHQHFGQI